MCILLLWMVVAALLMCRAEGMARPFVVTDIIHTSGTSSPLFQLPTWECSLSIFGVQADGDIHLTLIHLDHGRSLNISFEIRAYDGESQVTPSWLGDLVSVVTKEEVDLSLDEYTWFSIFRSKEVVTLYSAGATQPFLVYFNNHTANETNFLEFNSFQVSSLRNASWDFIGDKYDDENEATVPQGLESELQMVVEGTESRLDVIENFIETVSVNKLKKSNIRELLSELYWIKSYMMLINYYGYSMEGRNISEQVVNMNVMIHKVNDVLTPLTDTTTKTN